MFTGMTAKHYTYNNFETDEAKETSTNLIGEC
jgi:hypothetical protein